MERSERAKIFSSFNPLSGFSEALRQVEREVAERAELSPEREGEIDRLLHALRPGDMVTVVYHDGTGYRKRTGLCGGVDAVQRTLRVVDRVIPFDDIYDLRSE